MEEKAADNVANINIAYPEAVDLQLTISVGACRLKLVPGATDAWVSGTYADPSGALPHKIYQEAGRARVTHEPNWSSIFGIFSGAPRFDLALGRAKPYMISIESGASDNSFEFGGLPINRLQIKQGAGKMDINFSEPNPVDMTLLSVTAGAGNVEIRNLANANAAEISIDGGAAAYKFDFGGELRRDAHARISTGVSSVEIYVPGTTAAKIVPESPLGSMDVGDGFTTKEGAFWTKAALGGKTPVLTIYASVALGSMRIRTTA